MALDEKRLIDIGLGRGPKRKKAPPLPPELDDADDQDDDQDDDSDDDEDGIEYGDEADDSDDGPAESKDDGGPTEEQVHCAADLDSALQSGDHRAMAEAILALVGK